jgi:hypothetical protein
MREGTVPCFHPDRQLHAWATIESSLQVSRIPAAGKESRVFGVSARFVDRLALYAFDCLPIRPSV